MHSLFFAVLMYLSHRTLGMQILWSKVLRNANLRPHPPPPGGVSRLRDHISIVCSSTGNSAMRKARNSMFFQNLSKRYGNSSASPRILSKAMAFIMVFSDGLLYSPDGSWYSRLQQIWRTRPPHTDQAGAVWGGRVPLLPRVRKETHTFVHRSMHPMMALQNLHWKSCTLWLEIYIPKRDLAYQTLRFHD